MPTTRTIVVAPSGGDYTSLAAAEAAERGDIVATDEIVRFECYSMGSGVGDGTVTFGSWTTDATRYVEVVAMDRHAGEFDPDKYFISNTNSRGIYNGGGCRHLRLYGIQVRVTNTSGASSQPCFWFDTGTWTGAEILLDGCIGYGIQAGGTAALRGFHASSPVTGLVIRNCLAIVPVANSSVGFSVTGSSTPAVGAKILNCTVRGGVNGILGPSMSNTARYLTVKNTGIVGATTGFGSGNYHANSTNNATEDVTAVGSNPVTGFTPVFTGALSAILDPSDTDWKDKGADLTSDGVVEDIIGNPRSAPFDIGAYEIVLGGGGSIKSVPHYLARKRRSRR